MNLLEQFIQELFALLNLVSKDKDALSPIEKARILNAAIKLGTDLDAVKKYSTAIANTDSAYNEVMLQLGDTILSALIIKATD